MPRTKRGAKKVSVLITARDPRALQAKIRELKKQDYPNFEIVATLGGTVTEGYNRAIRRAKGEILVFTETDVVPLSRSWLSGLVTQVRPGEIIKGLEIYPPVFNFSNAACHAAIAKQIPLDERYRLFSDTEWYKRLVRHGIRLRTVYGAGVLHLRLPASKKAVQWAYQYGREWARFHRAGTFEEFESLVEQTRHQIAMAQAKLRGIADELKVSPILRRRRRSIPRDSSSRSTAAQTSR